MNTEIEGLISERSEILNQYECLHEKLIKVSKVYEESVRKIPILIDTAKIAEIKKDEHSNTSYGVPSIEASYISKQEIDYQKQKASTLNKENKLIMQEIQDLLKTLLVCDDYQLVKILRL